MFLSSVFLPRYRLSSKKTRIAPPGAKGMDAQGCEYGKPWPFRQSGIRSACDRWTARLTQVLPAPPGPRELRVCWGTPAGSLHGCTACSHSIEWRRGGRGRKSGVHCRALAGCSYSGGHSPVTPWSPLPVLPHQVPRLASSHPEGLHTHQGSFVSVT